MMVYGEQQHGFYKLGLNHRPAHRNNGLPGEDGSALGHGPHVAAKFKIGQILQKALAKNPLRAQKVDILLGKVQLLHIFNQLLHPRHNGKAAPVGHMAEKHIEIGDGFFKTVFKIAVGHGDFIKIGEHGQVFLNRPFGAKRLRPVLGIVHFSSSQFYACSKPVTVETISTPPAAII